MSAPSRPRPVVLCILDGWGHRKERADNGVLLAKTPNWHRFMATSPHALLQASERRAHGITAESGDPGDSEITVRFEDDPDGRPDA